jgi:hypothetical protein
VHILLDDDARWCRTCTIVQDVEEAALEQTCADCIEGDENKDVVMEDPYFVRVWRAVQLKRAGLPVLDLIDSLDDALAIHAVEAEVEHVQYEKRKAEGAGNQDKGLLQIEEP